MLTPSLPLSRSLGFAHLCLARRSLGEGGSLASRGSVHSLLPSQLYLDHSHCPRACASYPSCVVVYPRDYRSRRVLCLPRRSLGEGGSLTPQLHSSACRRSAAHFMHHKRLMMHGRSLQSAPTNIVL